MPHHQVSLDVLLRFLMTISNHHKHLNVTHLDQSTQYHHLQLNFFTHQNFSFDWFFSFLLKDWQSLLQSSKMFVLVKESYEKYFRPGQSTSNFSWLLRLLLFHALDFINFLKAQNVTFLIYRIDWRNLIFLGEVFQCINLFQ